MKHTCAIFFSLLILNLNALDLTAQSGRTTLLFNSGWRFHKGDTLHAEQTGFADRNWEQISLPHDWSIEGPFSQEWASGTAFLPAGIGWYRKTFRLPAGISHEKTFIYFDGVSNNSEVWLNGHELGKRPNGFISFQYDLTPFLIPDGPNVLAVRVDHSQFADSRWYIGSGIYRNVYLITTEKVHIGLWGVGFTTPVANAAHAEAQIQVALQNEAVKDVDAAIHCSLIDARGNIVAQKVKKIFLRQGDSTSALVDLSVDNPEWWSVEHPRLYKLKVSVTADGGLADLWQGSVGIRNIRFSADSGFFLNGKNIKLKGVCIHDDAGVLGVAVPEGVWYRRLQILKAAGCNSLRFSHNPHADYLYDLCDELGLLVMDEAFDEWEVGKNKWIKGWNVGEPGQDGYHEHFKQWAAKDLSDMVRRDRNHPSVIMWSIGNEIDYPNDPYTDSILNTGRNPQIYGKGFTPGHPPASRLGEISAPLVAIVKSVDSTRPVTAALAGVVMSNRTTFPQNLDIVGYNYQEFRYADDHATYPARIIYGSENGMQLSAWDAVERHPYISGQYLWTGIDYLGEAKKWPQHASGAGLIDMAGFPKSQYYFRQSLWSEKPMIHIGTTNITDNPVDSSEEIRDAIPDWNYTANARVRVSCFTNCTEAELFVNGHSEGRKALAPFASRVITWDLNYQAGKLLVKGYAKDGTITRDSLSTAGEPYSLAAKLSKDHAGLRQIEIEVVDRNGVRIYDGDHEITVKIEGPAKLLGLENGSLTDMENVHSTNRASLHGRLLAYVRTAEKAGMSRVTIQSPGLRSITIQIP